MTTGTVSKVRKGTLPSISASVDEVRALAHEAYVYLYPLVLMDITRRQATNAPAGEMIGRGPANEFMHLREFPSADFRDVVRPNFDTLYSVAWLDLTDGPVVISLPDTSGRYYLLPMLDMWTDVFACPGKRTTGTAAQQIAVVPPSWSGTLPAVLERIEAPTPHVWIIGRTQTNGVADYAAVNKIQDGLTITPVSDGGQRRAAATVRPDPTIDMKTPPMLQVQAMSARAFFFYAANVMKTDRPHIVDQPILARIKRIGIIPGETFDSNGFSPEVADALEKGMQDAVKAIADKVPTLARVVNGWQLNTDTMGVYGTYYLKRACIALFGLGANLPEDAVYPFNLADSDGKPLDGANTYVLHFEKQALPPVDAFWSVTLYDPQGFPYANELNRFALGDRDKLQYNADGSLDLYFQHASPGSKKESNWLPSPAGPFNLTMRLYGPRTEVTSGYWAPPVVKRT